LFFFHHSIMSDFVWIKLSSAEEDAFAKIFFPPCNDMADVAAHACASFAWGVTANKVRLYVVAKASDPKPLQPAIEAALKKMEPLPEEATMESAGVSFGAWLVAATTQIAIIRPVENLVPGRLSFGRGGGSGSIISERTNPSAPTPKLPSVSEAVGPTFEQEARDVLNELFRELCPWTTDHSPLLSRTLDSNGIQHEADIMCYVQGDTLVPCVAFAGRGVSLAELPSSTILPALPPMPLPAGEPFSPTDATRVGPHKYFLAEVYSGQREEKWTEKAQQLDTLCAFLMSRWQDRHPGMPAATDVTQIVGAAALIFSAGVSSRKELLRRAQEVVSAHLRVRCPNLSRLAAAGRLLIIMLDKSQAPITLFQRSVATHLESFPEELASFRREMSGVAEQVERLTKGVAELMASVKDLKG
jgi:hypothetical protein